eukprot:TRINITY_DN449_c0_g1_i2.p1 TRINITY_DN449_c0_g1~~TRINITY_DN449_c0_g1_i2.p1  ORF type:complete len:795 (-),score=95.88 TRINITY_DN449_c0_g1_i2:160-2544(-)
MTHVGLDQIRLIYKWFQTFDVSTHAAKISFTNVVTILKNNGGAPFPALIEHAWPEWKLKSSIEDEGHIIGMCFAQNSGSVRHVLIAPAARVSDATDLHSYDIPVDSLLIIWAPEEQSPVVAEIPDHCDITYSIESAASGDFRQSPINRLPLDYSLDFSSLSVVAESSDSSIYSSSHSRAISPRSELISQLSIPHHRSSSGGFAELEFEDQQPELRPTRTITQPVSAPLVSPRLRSHSYRSSRSSHQSGSGAGGELSSSVDELSSSPFPNSIPVPVGTPATSAHSSLSLEPAMLSRLLHHQQQPAQHHHLVLDEDFIHSRQHSWSVHSSSPLANSIPVPNSTPVNSARSSVSLEGGVLASLLVPNTRQQQKSSSRSSVSFSESEGSHRSDGSTAHPRFSPSMLSVGPLAGTSAGSGSGTIASAANDDEDLLSQRCAKAVAMQQEALTVQQQKVTDEASSLPNDAQLRQHDRTMVTTGAVASTAIDTASDASANSGANTADRSTATSYEQATLAAKQLSNPGSDIGLVSDPSNLDGGFLLSKEEPASSPAFDHSPSPLYLMPTNTPESGVFVASVRDSWPNDTLPPAVLQSLSMSGAPVSPSVASVMLKRKQDQQHSMHHQVKSVSESSAIVDDNQEAHEEGEISVNVGVLPSAALKPEEVFTGKEGYLQKQGLLIKSWKKRWIKLRIDAPNVYYYPSPSDWTPKGYLTLTRQSEVAVTVPALNQFTVCCLRRIDCVVCCIGKKLLQKSTKFDYVRVCLDVCITWNSCSYVRLCFVLCVRWRKASGIHLNVTVFPP